MMRQTAFMCVSLCLVLSPLLGCLTARSPAAARIQEADAGMVAGCTFLGEVHGTSAQGGGEVSIGIENAKTEALERAAAKGATHIVWDSVVGGEQPSASGKAYRCPAAPPRPAP